mmetsp:Transcript_16875/g.48004  ORF Transcript_16875/g.48004 Transcript_16875/m.48004 type:complete len:286 (-) Transcript_16875:140-997(-)
MPGKGGKGAREGQYVQSQPREEYNDAPGAALRRRIRWLNNAGGFGNQILYYKVAEASESIDKGRVFEILNYLEENWWKIRDPTAWICSSLDKANTAAGGLDADFDKRLRRRIRWLNTEGGFDNQIVYSKIAGAAVGVDDERVMEILRYLEDRYDKIGDPTAWVCAGLRKVQNTGGVRWQRAGTTRGKGGDAGSATANAGSGEGAAEEGGAAAPAPARVSARRYQDNRTKASDSFAQDTTAAPEQAPPEQAPPEPQCPDGIPAPSALELSQVPPKTPEDLDMPDLP